MYLIVVYDCQTRLYRLVNQSKEERKQIINQKIIPYCFTHRALPSHIMHYALGPVLQYQELAVLMRLQGKCEPHRKLCDIIESTNTLIMIDILEHLLN